MKHTLPLLLVVLFTCTNTCAQTDWARQKDSLVNALKSAKEDTAKVDLLLKTGDLYERNNPDTATYYYKAAEALSNKLHYTMGLLKFVANYTAVLDIQGKYKESLALNLQSIALAQQTKQPLRIATVYNNAAKDYYYLGDYNHCTDYFLKAAEILEQENAPKNQKDLAGVYANLAGIFSEIKQDQKAYLFGLKAIQLCRTLNDNRTLTRSLVNTGNTLFNLKKYDSAIVLLGQAKTLALKTNNLVSLESASLNLADVYNELHQYAQLKQNAEAALPPANALGDSDGVAKAYTFIGEYYLVNKQYLQAKQYVAKAVQIMKANDITNHLEVQYMLLSDIALALDNTDEYSNYRKLSDSITEATLSAEILKNTQELETKYALTKKEAEIKSLNDEKRIQALTIKQARTTNTALAVTLVILAVAGFLFINNVQQKRKLLSANTALQQQRIAELEMEKQFMAAQAVLKGQDEERSRLAKDLHDGLGGILSGAKYAFSNMKNNFIITPESAAAFDKSMAMLDKSISELRAVSHNMMPEALVQFGLDTALKDYCNSTQQTSALQITYQSYDVNEEAIPKPAASVVYRIVQELLNNIVKHAAAKTALVQLVQKQNSLSITVEDDGRGFDKTLLQNAEGIGFKNILNRVNYLKGTIDVETAPNRGTAITIEIPNLA